MKTISTLLLAGCLTSSSAAAAENLSGWGTNLVIAQRLARVADKPVLVYFTASWCGPCKLMAKTTLNDPAVGVDLDQSSRVLLDIDAQPAVATAFGVTAVPTFLLLDADGEVLLHASGYHDTTRFRAWLASGRQEFAAASGRRRQLDEEKAVILAAINRLSAPPADAVARLFNVAARRENAAQEFAVAQLKQLAVRDPALLLPGLTHTNLATRLRTANALREALGERFEFDPWETAEVRARQMPAIRAQMPPRP